MSWVGRALSSVSQYYREINPSTLSGAIDIVVVQRKHKDGSTELACSPFHVRFGKLTVLRPVDRKVVVRINGKEIPFLMKVGETGEAFFVFETDEDVPADMQTSPLAQPVPDVLTPQVEPDFLDLNEPSSSKEDSSSLKGSTPSTSHSAQDEEGKDVSDPSKGGSSLLQSTAARVSEIGSAVVSSVTAPTALITAIKPRKRRKKKTVNDEPSAVPEDLEDDQDEDSDVSEEVSVLEAHLKEDEGDLVSKRASEGEEVRQAFRQQTEAHRQALNIPLSSLPPYQHNATNQPGETLSKTPSQETQDLMLDMSGYKVKSEDQSKAKAIQSSLLSKELSERANQRLHDDLIVFTQALLRSADVHKTHVEVSMLEQALKPHDAGSLPADVTPQLEALSLGKDAQRPIPVPLQQQSGSGPASPLPSNTSVPRASSPTPSVTSIQPRSALTFFLTADDVEYEFQLAKIDNLENSEEVDERDFDLHLISFEDFKASPALVNDKNLVLRYKNQYLSWDNAAPVLASLAIYQKSIANAPPGIGEAPLKTNEKPNQGSVGRSWSRWWSKNKSETTLRHLDNTASEPPTRPTSPPPSYSESDIRQRNRSRSPSFDLAGEDPEGIAPEKIAVSGSTQPQDARHYAKTLRLTSDQLKTLDLKEGLNDISFSVSSSYSSNIVKCTSRIFLWDADYKIVVSDIDGTITKSDALGHVFTMIGRDWTHQGVAKLYTDISRNGYKMLYLTSRAIGQADTTREYLRGISQQNFILPEGPVLMSPDRLMTSLHREVIARKPEVFKMAALQDIQRLFASADKETKPFYAGFGNRITDALSYRSVDIPSSRIFTIDTYGDVVMELLELAGYKSSYIAMNDLVDQMFPPMNRQATPEYTDFNFWRAPLPQVDLPDLSPPSPALSARSDSSRWTLGNLASSITRRSSKMDLKDGQRSPRASSPAPKASSPLATAVLMAEDEPDELELNPSRRKRADSMPGSLSDEPILEEDSPDASWRMDIERQSSTVEDPEEIDDEDDELDFSNIPY